MKSTWNFLEIPRRSQRREGRGRKHNRFHGRRKKRFYKGLSNCECTGYFRVRWNEWFFPLRIGFDRKKRFLNLSRLRSYSSSYGTRYFLQRYRISVRAVYKNFFRNNFKSFPRVVHETKKKKRKKEKEKRKSFMHFVSIIITRLWIYGVSRHDLGGCRMEKYIWKFGNGIEWWVYRYIRERRGIEQWDCQDDY